MNRQRVSRNDPCPCGSGRKFKKCCYLRERWITPEDRGEAILLLDRYAERCAERSKALEIFCAGLDTDVPAMNEHFQEISESAFLLWFAFDYRLDDGSYLVDRILKANPRLPSGERRFLEQLRSTAMMPYEVIAVRPGESVVLRRLGDEDEIEVREKSGSRAFKRWDMLVARLNPVGPTGGPEIEMGAMPIPNMARDEITAVVQEELDRQPDRDGLVQAFKDLGPEFHEIWLVGILDPRLPTPLTPDGDPVVLVTMQYDVLDEDRVRLALDAKFDREDEGEGEIWSWNEDELPLGAIQLDASQLTFETHSEPWAERGRQLLERIAGDALTYRSCERFDPREDAARRILSGEHLEPRSDAEDGIPPEVEDQLFQEAMAEQSQEWLDEQIPALDGQTPRFAARSSTLRPHLIGLLKGMENGYLRALVECQPAFDPTWMWDELGLSGHPDAPRTRHPLWLAHESLEHHLPGVTQVVTSVAEARYADEAGLARNAVTQRGLQVESPVQELIQKGMGRLESGDLLAHLELYCNYEIQRRKTFWVDESLAWMLANTQVDAESSLFRLPFPSYVLVYTDRHTLSVAERALARDPDCPLRGQMLAVLCVYVVEFEPDSRRVKLGVTFDAFEGQPPHLMTWELHVDPDQTLEQTIGDALARTATPAAGLFRPLLETAVNTTLYTASAGFQIEQYRVDPPQQPDRGVPTACLAGDAVYYLPGKIAISHMRKLQQLARGPSGRTLMHRFMVRGHWRRPNPNWKNQALRWIEPYWRGPSLASIVEREYRVKP